MENLQRFIGSAQLQAMKRATRGEEGAYFRGKVKEVCATIDAMPKTYETDGQGDEAKATLHYFYGSSDWYIIEKDMCPEQYQAFGFACLNGDKQNAELGYINIEELVSFGVELDLYYTPEPIGTIRARFAY
jgi:hypothetical protein